MPLNTLVTTRRPSPRRAALAVAAVSLVLALAVGCAPQTPVASDGRQRLERTIAQRLWRSRPPRR